MQHSFKGNAGVGHGPERGVWEDMDEHVVTSMKLESVSNERVGRCRQCRANYGTEIVDSRQHMEE